MEVAEVCEVDGYKVFVSEQNTFFCQPNDGKPFITKKGLIDTSQGKMFELTNTGLSMLLKRVNQLYQEQLNDKK